MWPIKLDAMRTYIFNVPALMMGLVAGSFIPLHQWLNTPEPTLWETTYRESMQRLADGNHLRVRTAKRQTSSAADIPGNEFPQLDLFLNKRAREIEPAKHPVMLMEISRAEGAERLLTSAYNWQRKNTGANRDLIVLIAPIHQSGIEEYRIANALAKSLKSDSPEHQWGKGKMTFLFRSQENIKQLSLSSVLTRARRPLTARHFNLSTQPILGSIDHIFWVRTTINRWELLPASGLVFEKTPFSLNQITTLLVEPNRKLVTSVNLKRSSQPSAQKWRLSGSDSNSFL